MAVQPARTRRRWFIPLLVAVALVVAAGIASIVLYLNWRPDAEDYCGRPCSAEHRENIELVLGLDKPGYELYWDYLGLVWECRDLDPPPIRVDRRRSRCDQPRPP